MEGNIVQQRDEEMEIDLMEIFLLLLHQLLRQLIIQVLQFLLLLQEALLLLLGTLARQESVVLYLTLEILHLAL